jgi:hypothetical protein
MKVVRVGFDGAKEVVLQADRDLSPLSLGCSEENNVVVVFSYDGSELFIAAGGRVGRYATPISGANGYRLARKFLSPDGGSIVLPFGVRLLDGDDVLQSMRVVLQDYYKYAWFNDSVIYSDPNDMVVYSKNLTDGTVRKLADLKARFKNQKFVLESIHRCRDRFVASVLLKKSLL